MKKLRGSAEVGRLFQPGGNCSVPGVDDRGDHGLSAAPIRAGIGGDGPLVDAVGHGDRVVAAVNGDGGRLQRVLVAMAGDGGQRS